MKILVVSDTHKKHANLQDVIRKEYPFDAMIHLGDVEGFEHYITGLVDCPVEMVAGNNDFFSELPNEKEIMLGNQRVLITHGHYYYVSASVEEIKREAKGRGMDIVMFGHTHRPIISEGEGIVAINPGSISYPRQDGHLPSYIIMEMDENGYADFTIKYLD